MSAGPRKPARVRRSGAVRGAEFEVVRVPLGDRSYDICIGCGILSECPAVLRRRCGNTSPNAMVFTSPTVGRLYYGEFRRGLARAGFTRIARHDIPDGDEHKNLEEYCKAMNALAARFRPDSQTGPVLFNLGGGVISDLGGFVAGTYARGNGATCVHIPTTLLACVDSSVGGKVGVNVLSFKNQVGMFYQPRLVFIDLATLDTLDGAEYLSGMAEVVKYGAVCDADLFALLERNAPRLLSRDKALLRRVVERCCQIKARIVTQDERDTAGRRIVLNFGHTIGHALETASDFKVRHGEAVAVGMLAETRLATAMGICSRDVQERLSDLIGRLGLPTTAGGLGMRSRLVMRAMQRDKKFAGGRNCFAMPTRLGSFTVVRGAPERMVLSAVRSCLAGSACLRS